MVSRTFLLARIRRDLFILSITGTNSSMSKSIDVYTYLSINFSSPMNVDRRHVFCIQELYQYALFHRTDISLYTPPCLQAQITAL